jgi:hypothetical protein
MRKRMGYLKLHEQVTLDKAGLTIRAYSKRNKFLGRVEITTQVSLRSSAPRGKDALAT